MAQSWPQKVDPFEGYVGSASKAPLYESLLELGWSGLARSQLAIERRSKHAAHLVVMHVAPPEVASDDELRDRFALRAATLLPLRHPNVVRTLAYVADGRDAYWVTEAVQGQPLSLLLSLTLEPEPELLPLSLEPQPVSSLAGTSPPASLPGARERALSVRQLVRVSCDVLRGLDHLHRAVDAGGAPRPIVHGSLSPASVLVSYDGRVKLDVSAVPGFPRGSRGALAAHALRSAYQAPECLQGAAPDQRADLYAVGAMLWEGIFGRTSSSLTWASQSALSSLAWAPRASLAWTPGGTGSHALELANVSPGVLPALAAIARRALAPDPAARHQSARELLGEIEALDLSLAFRGERGSLFGFMCNHFCEEHAALQELLAERAPDIIPDPPEPEEGHAADTSEHVTLAADLSEPVTLAADPIRRSIVPGLPASQVAHVASPAEPLESSPADPRLRQALIALSIAAAAAFGVIVAQPSHPEPLPSESTPAALGEPKPPALAERPSPRPSFPAPSVVEAASDRDAPQTSSGNPVLDERWTARRARLRRPAEQRAPSERP